MNIEATTIFTGPNIYSAGPVVRHTLRFQAAPTTERFAAFFEALCDALPGLGRNRCTRGAPDCFTGKGKLELNHLFEHVCIELQNIAGAEVGCARCDNTSSINVSEAIVAYEEAEVCIEAARVAARCFTEFLESDSSAVDFTDTVEAFRDFSERKTLPVQDRVLMRSAHERDIPATRLMGRILQLGHGCHQQRLNGTKTTLTNIVSNDIAANKDYSRRLLGQLGLPIPRYERVYRSRDAVECAERIGYPVVVKPVHGNLGRGVSVGMRNAKEVRAAYKRAREYGRSVLIEELVGGADYRILVIDGKLCAAAKREPAHVVGDGSQTVEQLVDQLNQDPRRGVGARFSWTRINFDAQADRLLDDLGYTRQSVPSEGEFVYLRRNANTSDGGTAVDVTDEIHPDNCDIAVRAALAVGLDIAGVDFLTTDIRRSMWETGGAICEINSRPGMRKHMWPAEGPPRDVTGPVVDMLFPRETKSRIPISAVTGTGNRSGVARMLAHVLAQSGRRYVGLVTMGQAFINGHPIGRTSLVLPEATRVILLDPRVDALVIDANPEEIRRYGLGHDACDSCVIVEADPPGTISSDVIEAVGVLARTAREAIVVGTALPCDPGNATCYRVGWSDESDPSQPSIELEKNDSGVASGIRVSGEHPVNIALGGDLKLLSDEPREIEQCVLYACAAAVSLGIETGAIERSLKNFADGSYRDDSRFVRAAGSTT